MVIKIFSILYSRRETTLASTNIKNRKSTILKILKGDLSKAGQQTSKSRRTLPPVNEKRGSRYQDNNATPPDLQHSYKQT
ncbi:hypothetical protein KFK09_003489 [Dendrobium nobile]|uniref:Uncharacterized protein n=1 Tax=Dendrobium nobile TaxID=94219 RepID=A0A8T3C2Q3_DENNO|nr:hypothetical protein KFK09_003489 [Dendrobium nobile]